jgi:hypothetical protein
VRTLLPDDQQLLFDQQLRDASFEQLQDLIARVDLLLRSKGQSGLTLHHPKMSVTPQSLPIPQTQVPSAANSSLCPEKAEGQRSRIRVTSLALPRLGSRGVHPTEYLYV